MTNTGSSKIAKLMASSLNREQMIDYVTRMALSLASSYSDEVELIKRISARLVNENYFIPEIAHSKYVDILLSTNFLIAAVSNPQKFAAVSALEHCLFCLTTVQSEKFIIELNKDPNIPQIMRLLIL